MGRGSDYATGHAVSSDAGPDLSALCLNHQHASDLMLLHQCGASIWSLAR